jgi:hypothetical protein
VAAAVNGATVQLNLPLSDRVQFQRDQLGEVARLFREQGSRDETLEAVNMILRDRVGALDLERSTAALALLRRLEAQTNRVYREGPGGRLEVLDERPLSPPE